MGKTKLKENPTSTLAMRTATSSMLPDEGVEGGLPPALQMTLDKILLAITDTKTALQTQIGTVATELGLLRADHQKLNEKVKVTESSLEEIKPEHDTLQLQVRALTARVQVLENREEDAEVRSHRSNIRIVGLPEKEEGDDMVGYLEEWMKTRVAQIDFHRSLLLRELTESLLGCRHLAGPPGQ